MKKTIPFPCQANDAVLMVTSYHKGNLRGWLTHPQLSSIKEIESISHLLFILTDLLKQEHALISFYAYGSEVSTPTQCIATIHIQILFQEHYTWQGTLLWEEKQCAATFRSVLELILILDEMLANN